MSGHRPSQSQTGFAVDVRVEVGELPLGLAMARGKRLIAPSAVAKALADEPALAALEETGPTYVSYQQGSLVARYRDRVSDATLAAGRAALAVLGRRLSELLAEHERGILISAPRTGAAFREEVDPGDVAARRQQWLGEIAATRRRLLAPTWWWRRRRTAAAPVLLILTLAWLGVLLLFCWASFNEDDERRVVCHAADPRPAPMPQPGASVEPPAQCTSGDRDPWSGSSTEPIPRPGSRARAGYPMIQPWGAGNAAGVRPGDSPSCRASASKLPPSYVDD